MVKKEKSILSVLKWLDDNIISLLAGFLLAFIPLYPKVPLFDALPGYIVRVRLEDIFVLITFVIWLIWLLRKKIILKDNPLYKLFAVYLIVGILSMLSAVFIVKTVPMELLHIQKMALHYFRRIEYFSLFFILFSAVKSSKIFKIYTYILLFTIVGVTIYGFGQKYFYWPAFSTMNREFSKGWLLYLNEHSRVLSTFGGHYDLAAFLMMMLTLLWSLIFGIKSRVGKVVLFITLLASFWILILTASRTSFIAYIGAVTLMIFLWIFKKKFSWVLGRWVGVVFLSMFIMLSFGDLSERFTKLLKLEQRFGGIKEILLRPATDAPKDKAVFLVNNLQAVTSKSDQPPVTFKPGDKPVDVINDIPNQRESATQPGKIEFRPRTYSPTAMQYDLSTGIRLDALWPRAIAGFLRNPLLGSGYSTLTKEKIEVFTEAESTDNDYLRMLGETGILGTISFLGIIAYMLYIIWRSLSGVEDPIYYSLYVGAIGLTFGMLINAIYIDVFEASKVAYTYWSFMGLVLGSIRLNSKAIEANRKPFKITFDFNKLKKSFIEAVSNDKFLMIIILILAFYLRLYRIDNPVADWHSWRQADTAAVTRNFEKHGKINFLYPQYDDLSSVASGKQNPKGLRMVEFPIYNAVSVFIKKMIPEGPLERSMRLTSIFVSLGTIIFLFLITRKYINRRVALIAAFIYSILPYNIYYNRVILPEPFLVFLSLGSFYFFDKYIESLKPEFKKITKIKYFLLTLLFASLSILVKPFAAFMFFPLAYLAYRSFSFKLYKVKSLYLLIILVIIPFVLWRLWINQFPEGIPAYQWLLNGDGIRFKGAFFFWIFADRIGRLILGYWGLALFVIGLALKPLKNEGWLFRWLLVGSLAYLFTFATGNVRHDYYQIFIIPSLVIFVAKGIDFLISQNIIFSKYVSILIAVVSLIFMEAFAWYHIRDLFNINHPEIVLAGQAVDRLTPKNSLVIAPYNGDTAFLYQTNRAGWPLVEGTIQDHIKRGADYYVGVDYDDLTKRLISEASPVYLHEKYFVIEKTSDYVIIQLVPNYELPKD